MLIRSACAGLTLVAMLATAPAHAIANGKPVTDRAFASTFPWMVAVVSSIDGGVCGGALIAPQWVVTAAHCTSGEKFVLAGNADRGDARKIAIDRAVRHPEFSADTMENDVGMLHLTEAVDVTPVPLATVGETLLLLINDTPATIAGWGWVEANGPPVERLHSADIVLTQIGMRGSKVAFVDTGSGPCARDSGGPLIMEWIDHPVLVGVASGTSGNLCATGGGRSVYSNLSTATKFIQSLITGK